MRALLAFDKFKDSLTAPEACRIAADVLRGMHPEWTLDSGPLADGGEGFCAILTPADVAFVCRMVSTRCWRRMWRGWKPCAGRRRAMANIAGV